MNTKPRRIVSISILVIVLACAPAAQTRKAKFPPEERDRIKKIFAAIDERNRTEKRSEAWLRSAYASIGIKKVNDIPPSEYASYGRYVTDGEVYIIVHPGYFPFFDKWHLPPPAPITGDDLPAENLSDRLTADLPADEVPYRVAREQGRILRDFIEFMSEENKLVVIVLPRDYKINQTYGYQPGRDEYARYINEITNRSESIVYVESDTATSGYILDKDLDVLDNFLTAAGVKTVKLGGGYLAKCLDNFYGSIRGKFAFEAITYVTELTAISPAEDMVTGEVDLLDKDGRINMKSIRKYISTVSYNRSNGDRIRTKNLTLYSIYQNR